MMNSLGSRFFVGKKSTAFLLNVLDVHLRELEQLMHRIFSNTIFSFHKNVAKEFSITKALVCVKFLNIILFSLFYFIYFI